MPNSVKQVEPFFSIIVPTFNRPEKLADCLNSLARLDYPYNRFQVVVVDDGSQVSPAPVVSRFYHRLDMTLIQQGHAGPAAARNKGAKEAMGEYFAFTDDDCQPASDWLRRLALRFETLPGHAIGGQTLNTLQDNLYSTASELIIGYLYAYYNADPGKARFFTSNNLALPAENFHAIHGFNPAFPRAAGEDREFCERWLDHGFRMTYAPEVQVYHHHALTLSAFCRQHVNYGRGAFRFHKIRRQGRSGRFRIEPLSFYSNLLGYPFSSERKESASLFSALLFITQIANAAGFLWEWMKQKSK